MPISKVRGGTTPSESLCHTCSHAFICQGEGIGEQVVCRTLNELRILTKIVRCTHYHDKRDKTPSLQTMADMAFILTEQGPLKKVGFVASREWKKANDGKRVLPYGTPDYYED